MSNILLLGNGAREHAMAEAISRSAPKPHLFSFMKANNPGIASLSETIKLGSYSDLKAITDFATENKIEFAVIGPEDPLNNGVVDALAKIDIPSVRSHQKSGASGNIQIIHPQSGEQIQYSRQSAV